MDNDPQGKISDLEYQDSVAVLMRSLPKPVQDFLTGPERDKTVLELSSKYNLHADQAGVFEKTFIHMLLGVISPDEFVKALTDKGISAEGVRGLAQDVNEQVFIPLRKAEEEQGVAPTAPQPAIAPSAGPEWVQVTPSQAATPAPVAIPPQTVAPAAPQYTAPTQPQPAPPPAPQYVAPPQSIPSYSTVPTQQPRVSAPPANLPIGHTMAGDREAAQIQYEAAASLGLPPQPVTPPAWTQGQPQPQAWTAPPQPLQYSPPPMPPGYWPAQPAPTYLQPQPQMYTYPAPQPPPPPMPPASQPPATTPPPEIPTPKPPAPLPPQQPTDPRAQAHDRFGLDPYREPIV